MTKPPEIQHRESGKEVESRSHPALGCHESGGHAPIYDPFWTKQSSNWGVTWDKHRAISTRPKPHCDKGFQCRLSSTTSPAIGYTSPVTTLSRCRASCSTCVRQIKSRGRLLWQRRWLYSKNYLTKAWVILVKMFLLRTWGWVTGRIKEVNKEMQVNFKKLVSNFRIGVTKASKLLSTAPIFQDFYFGLVLLI